MLLHYNPVPQIPITFFSAPRGFDVDTSARQRSAILSWKLLPGPMEGILLGDETGVEEMAKELGFAHSSKFERSPDDGIPLMDSMFQEASRLSSHEVMCYLNADISLPPQWYRSIQRVLPWILEQGRPFLIAGPRLVFPQDVMWTYNESFSTWETRNKAHFRQVVIDGAIDWFVFRRGAYDKMPPWKLGRYVWDSWMVAHATREKWVSVTTFTRDRAPQHVYGIHWDHSRRHHDSKKGVAVGRSDENFAIAHRFGGGLHPSWGRLRGQELGLVVKDNGDHVIVRRFDYDVIGEAILGPRANGHVPPLRQYHCEEFCS